MKQVFTLSIISLCLMFFLCACGKTPDPPGTMPPPAPVDRPQDVAWIFQKDAISLTIIASDDLNITHGEPRAVSICIYQTESPDLLEAKAETEQGLRELLLCKSNPPERFQAEQIYVQPGSIIEETLDRAEGAKYFAVVAGFNVLNPITCFSIIPIPLNIEKTRQWTILFSKENYNAAEMEARIDLSSESVYLQGTERVQK